MAVYNFLFQPISPRGLISRNIKITYYNYYLINIYNIDIYIKFSKNKNLLILYLKENCDNN